MLELKKTALHSLHLQLSAKMVAFAGYHMPLQYADGIIKEHLHCRQQAGFFDVSHMGQISITGAFAAVALETLTAGNITGLQPGHQRYIVLTNETGGIIDDAIISRMDSGFLLVVNAACKEKDFKYLKHHLSTPLSTPCQIKLLQSQALLALQGPAAKTIMFQLSATASTLNFMQTCSTQIDNMPCIISRCGYTGEDGFEISIDNKYAEKLARIWLDFDAVKAIGLGARDTLRLEAGLGLYGSEFNEFINPLEAGLSWTFRKNATHFPGADIIQSQLQTGINKRSVGLLIEGKSIIRNNTPLYDDNGSEIGVVTSGGYSPGLKKPIALALIDNAYSQQHLVAKLRNRMITCHITALPFVAHRYHR